MRELPDYYTDDPPPRPTTDVERQAIEDDHAAERRAWLVDDCDDPWQTNRTATAADRLWTRGGHQR